MPGYFERGARDLKLNDTVSLRFEVLTTVKVPIVTVWVVRQYSPASGYELKMEAVRSTETFFTTFSNTRRQTQAKIRNAIKC
jgi:hypothetical protein